MTNKRIIKLFKCNIQNHGTNKQQFEFTVYLLTFCFLLFNELYHLKINQKLIKQQLKKVTMDEIYKLVEVACEHPNEANFKCILKYLLSVITYNQNICQIGCILELFITTYYAHQQLSSFEYFYDKKYNETENNQNVEKFSKIMSLILQINTELKNLFPKHCSQLIKFAKLAFMKAGNEK